MIETAIKFGRSLDKDDFDSARQTLTEGCEYLIGDLMIVGAQEIISTYHQNSIEGRRKFDKLIWGECRIEEIEEGQYWVHFEDYLGHNGKEHTYRCRQKLFTDKSGLIYRIEHHEIDGEREKLDNYKRDVGLD